MRRQRKPIGPGKAVLLAAFLVTAAVLGALMAQRYEARRDFPSARNAGPSPYRIVTLFFSAPEEERLVREAREIECEGFRECIRETVMELVKGPLGDLEQVLPSQTVLREVRVEGDVAYLDFGPELREGLAEYPEGERLAAYAVADTVAFNFPEVRRVAFLIGGAPAETLAGTVDIRSPLLPDFSLEQAAAQGGRK